MAYAAPRISGNVGVKLPVGNFNPSVIESFPRPNRDRNVESSVIDRFTLKIPPTNATLTNSLNDRYLVFEYNGTKGVFLDLSSIGIEFFIKFLGPNGAAVDAATNFVPVNHLLNTLFRSVSIFINDRLIESCPYFGYQSFIKSIVTMKSSSIKSRGRLAFLHMDHKGSGIINTYGDDYFKNLNTAEKTWVNRCRTGLHLVGSLFVDIATVDQYLLDDINVKVKLEMNSNNWIINSNAAQPAISIALNDCNLLIDRITPRSNALLALHQTLNKPNTTIDYLFNKTLHRTYSLAPNQTTINLDRPFGSVIPEKLFIVFCDMNSFNGSFTKNGIYFHHEYLQKLQCTINGSSVYDMSANFPDDYSELYYESLKTLSLDYDSLLHYDSFNSGRMIVALNFISELKEDALELEKSGNLRIQMTFATPRNENRIILLLGETQGIMSIDGERNINVFVRG